MESDPIASFASVYADQPMLTVCFYVFLYLIKLRLKCIHPTTSSGFDARDVTTTVSLPVLKVTPSPFIRAE